MKGYKGAANAGDCGAANAGDCGAANAGDYGAAIVGEAGKASVGAKGIAISTGNEGKAKGGLGSLLVLIERDDEGNIIKSKAAIVDGKKIKSDIWYKLENGKFVEVE